MVSYRYEQDPESGEWVVTGDDGDTTVTIRHESRDEATALAREAFGFTAYRPPPPLPPGWHRFGLTYCPIGLWDIKFDDPRFDGIKAVPPSGCQVEDAGGYFALECERQAPTLLEAVAELCAEIRAEHGLMMSDLGVEKVEEWCSGGLDGWGAKILGQLLLMAIERAPLLGYRIDDLVDFLRTAAGEDCAPAHSAGDR